MHATVYRFRERGLKLPRPRQGVSGNLQLVPLDANNGRAFRAKLVAETGATLLLPELHDAQVHRITEHGIKITGSEVIARRSNNKSSADHYRQVWWCLVHTVFIGQSLDLIEIDEFFRPVVPKVQNNVGA